MKMKKTNVALIGMCGAGKSTVGVILAKIMGLNFLDTDVYIQSLENRSLQQIIDAVGLNEFCKIEENYILSLNVKNTVVATGGSAVYSEKAVKHLQQSSIIVHLDLPFDLVQKRVTDLYKRGIVMEKGQTLENLYQKRQPLYHKYAQITVDCSNKNQQQLAEEIAAQLKKM